MFLRKVKGKYDLPHVKLAFFFYTLRPGVSRNFHGISLQLLTQSTSNHPPPHPLPSLGGEAASWCTGRTKFHYLPEWWNRKVSSLRWSSGGSLTSPSLSWDTLTMVPRRKTKLIYLPQLHLPFSGLPGTQCCEVSSSARPQDKRLYVDYIKDKYTVLRYSIILAAKWNNGLTQYLYSL